MPTEPFQFALTYVADKYITFGFGRVLQGGKGMVNEVKFNGLTAYKCELCGAPYADLETAERCEQYCYSHGGSSEKITRKAIRKPSARADPIAA